MFVCVCVYSRVEQSKLTAGQRTHSSRGWSACVHCQWMYPRALHSHPASCMVLPVVVSLPFPSQSSLNISPCALLSVPVFAAFISQRLTVVASRRKAQEGYT